MPRTGRSGRLLLVPFRVESGADVSVALSTPEGEEVARYRVKKPPGAHVVTLDVSALPASAYRCRVTAGAEAAEKEFRLRR